MPHELRVTAHLSWTPELSRSLLSDKFDGFFIRSMVTKGADIVTRSFLALASLTIACGVQAQISVSPSSPRAQDVIRIQIPPSVIGQGATPDNDYDPRGTLVSMDANKISVSLLLTNNGTGLSSHSLDLPVGQFPAGTYQVEVTRRRLDGTLA